MSGVIPDVLCGLDTSRHVGVVGFGFDVVCISADDIRYKITVHPHFVEYRYFERYA